MNIKKYVEGTPRNQLCLFSESLDKIISREHIVRFIDSYVEKLDLFKLEIHNIENKKGRPGYNPTLYLKIFIFSYLNRLRSSRKIERECKRNLELIWLTRQLAPDHWSISNFRKTNSRALKNLFKDFLTFCHKLELMSFDCVAIDGTKMRAQNHLSNVYKRSDMDKLLEQADKKIKEYLEELENNDEKDKDEYEFLNQSIPNKLKRLESHKEKLKIINEIFQDNPEFERYFANDPDSRFQKDNGRVTAGYNCQSAVDEKNKLIIAADVTNENNDLHQLNNMKSKIDEAKKELKVEKKTVGVADAGYHTESQIIKALEDEQFDIYVPHPKDEAKKKTRKSKKNKIPAEGFEVEDFKYDSEHDQYICPEGKILERGGSTFDRGIKRIRYACKKCTDCKSHHLCTTQKIGRRISVGEHYITIKASREKVNSKVGKKIVQKRKDLVEHPFGTIKRNMGFRYFMLTGIENTRAEFSFIAFIYNLKRVVNIIGISDLITSLE